MRPNHGPRASPGHLYPALHAGDALLKVPQHPVDNPELPVRSGRGSGLAQVMADHQTLLKADLTNKACYGLLPVK